MGYATLKDYVFTLETGSAWGTAKDVIPTSIITDQEVTFNLEPTKHRFERLRGIRTLHEAESWNESSSAVPTVTTNNILLTATTIRNYLNAAFPISGAWTAVSSNYNFYPQSGSYLPLYKSNQGYFHTITRRSPTSNDSLRVASAIPKSMKLKIDPIANDSCLMADIEWLACNLQDGVNPTASVFYNSIPDVYTYSNISLVEFDSTDITADFISAEINYTNNAKFVSDLPDKEIVFPKFEVNGTFKVVASADADVWRQEVFTQGISSAKLLTIDFDISTQSSDLRLQVNCMLTDCKTDLTEGEVLEFSFEGVAGATAGVYPIKIVKHT